MADAVSISMGGRVASIHRKNVKRRKYTTVVNEIENKRLGFVKKQLAVNKATEYNRLQRTNERMINANDEMKAFQVALLRRVGVVKEQSKLASSTRPLVNLGRYGGASVEYIKAESEKYKRIRDPKTRRLIKAKIFLEQSKRDGRIKEFDPKSLGNMAEDILKLYKAEIPDVAFVESEKTDTVNLDDLLESNVECGIKSPSSHTHTNFIRSKPSDFNRATYPLAQAPQLILPPLQIKRSLNPNSNYYRKISADFHKREAILRARQVSNSPIHRRLSILEDITEDGKHCEIKRNLQNDPANEQFSAKSTMYPITSIANYKPRLSGKSKQTKNYVRSYEWEYERTLRPVQLGKHLNENQKFWKPQESISSKTGKTNTMPRIR